MKKRLFLLSIGFSVALAATAQTSGQDQTPPVSSTTPATQLGNGAQTKAGTPAASSTTAPASTISPVGQSNPPEAAQSPGQATTPAVPAIQNPSPEATNAGMAAPNDAELEGQIQNALNKEPTLTGDSTHVTVSADTIELAGNVSTSKAKITATRIVQSYAGSKKLMNHLTIGGKGEPRTSQQQESPNANHPASSTNPATGSESIKSSPSPAPHPPRF